MQGAKLNIINSVLEGGGRQMARGTVQPKGG